jgi:hypothetical protein
MDLLDNPVGCPTSPAFFRAKALKNAFLKVIVRKLKFPNNITLYGQERPGQGCPERVEEIEKKYSIKNFRARRAVLRGILYSGFIAIFR